LTKRNKVKNLTDEEHRKIHVELHDHLDILLHDHLDILVQDMMSCTGMLPSQITVVELMDWSYEQTRED